MQNKKILLLNPWIHDFSAYDFWVRPLGLLTLAALLRQSGFKVQMIDCLDPFPDGSGFQGVNPGPGSVRIGVVESSPARRFRSRRHSGRSAGATVAMACHRTCSGRFLQAAGRPDLVLVGSMMTYWYPGVVEAIGEVRAAWPGVPVLLGGNYATLCPEHARAFSGADVVIAGDGEFALPPVLGDLFGARVDFDFDGSALDSYPYPALDLIGHLDAVPILTSRGCPYRCSYCASNLLNRGFRMRDPCGSSTKSNTGAGPAESGILPSTMTPCW